MSSQSFWILSLRWPLSVTIVVICTRKIAAEASGQNSIHGHLHPIATHTIRASDEIKSIQLQYNIWDSVPSYDLFVLTITNLYLPWSHKNHTNDVTGTANCFFLSALYKSTPTFKEHGTQGKTVREIVSLEITAIWSEILQLDTRLANC